ncbi:MAG: hypothetical protein QOG64_160, partial [Acidimicrobiaceae bacterium]|nr:hypothetical protein [Acidimicrobiaceae bacterium]
PSVLGRPVADARQRLLNAGFGVTTVPARPSSGPAVPAGGVWRQDPEPGSRVGRGQMVSIYFSPDG